MSTAEQAFKNLVFAAQEWTQHMDQWERFKFGTHDGPVYVTISMSDDYPDSFDTVSLETGLVVKPGIWQRS